MFLPEYVTQALDRLENAGFAAYAVGGCVRDSVLGLTPHDYDLCTAAKPETIKELFSDRPLVLAGEKHGTISVVTDAGLLEITTFRTEGSYHDNRHPDWVEFVDEIEGDLARRDFTVNAMAYSPKRGFADPFGGRQDLKDHVLRAVGDPRTRFREDSLRILRGVRFAVRYGLTPEVQAEQAMVSLAPLMDNLARERVFDELCKLLVTVTPADILRFAPILIQPLPELAPTVGFDQHSVHHAYDVFTHTAQVTGSVAPILPLRWAALLHDCGKPGVFTMDAEGHGHFFGHAAESARLADAALRRLKAPTALRERAVFLIEKHMTPLEPDRKLLRRRLSQYGEEPLRQLLMLQQADFGSKGVTGESPRFEEIPALLEKILGESACLTVKDLAVSGRDLMALGLQGRQIGQTLDTLLSRVLDETLPNEKEALRKAAEELQAGDGH